MLHISRPNFHVPVTTEIVDTLADRSALRLTKRLFHGVELLESIELLDNEAEREVITWNKLRIKPSHPTERINRFLEVKAKRRQPLVKTFLQEHPRLVKEDKTSLRDLYDLNDYQPINELKKQFIFKWQFLRK
jgi:hypothetical protein